MSEKLCYFCKEHEMRPLPNRKTGREVGKTIQGAFRLLAVTWETLQTTRSLAIREGVARWPHAALD